MKFASKSAIESESSAKAGSSPSSGKADDPCLELKVWLSRRDVRELGRRGVEGREGGWARVAEVERLAAVESITGESTGQKSMVRTETQWVLSVSYEKHHDRYNPTLACGRASSLRWGVHKVRSTSAFRL